MKDSFICHGAGVVMISAIAIVGMGIAEGFSSASMHWVLLACFVANVMEFLFSLAYNKYYGPLWVTIPLGVLVTGSWGWVIWEIITTDIFLVEKIGWLLIFLISGSYLLQSHFDTKWEEVYYEEGCSSSGGSWGNGGFSCSDFGSGNYGGRD